MSIKSWRPNSIITKPVNAFVGLNTAEVNEQEAKGAEILVEGHWSVAQFPELSANQNISPVLIPGKNSQANDQLHNWEPREIDTSYVVNHDVGSRLSRSGGNTSYQNQRFDDVIRKSDSILTEANTVANEIISKAEKKATEIIQQAENQATQLTHQAYQDGLAAANAEISDLLKTARAIAEEVDTWRENTLAKGEMMMLRLVIEIAQSLFGEGLPLDPDTLGNAFSRALTQAKTLGDLRIYVHPEDALALTPHWAQQQATFSGQKIELIPSDIIKRGGCFIEGQYGSVDARIETQLQMTKDTLMETLALPVGHQE